MSAWLTDPKELLRGAERCLMGSAGATEPACTGKLPPEGVYPLPLPALGLLTSLRHSSSPVKRTTTDSLLGLRVKELERGAECSLLINGSESWEVQVLISMFLTSKPPSGGWGNLSLLAATISLPDCIQLLPTLCWARGSQRPVKPSSRALSCTPPDARSKMRSVMRQRNQPGVMVMLPDPQPSSCLQSPT
ncbi:hypothetical protein NDU88_007401 [Pleurodeles waltl]|uniref:Uncharacterized protein n=1 Tax=Pleurodeles waltl TaxID=8319 RepID=A0AAV7RRU6_PLEWA|nr:hypothetical protein NDU88_007401 [Pleurodeles waltl]